MVDVREWYKIPTEQRRQFLNTVRAGELKLWGKDLTIASVRPIQLKGATKLALEFNEIDDILVLNHTNAMTLVKAYGTDTDLWIGKTIELKKVKRTFKGKAVDGIEIVTGDDNEA